MKKLIKILIKKYGIDEKTAKSVVKKAIAITSNAANKEDGKFKMEDLFYNAYILAAKEKRSSVYRTEHRRTSRIKPVSMRTDDSDRVRIRRRNSNPSCRSERSTA